MPFGDMIPRMSERPASVLDYGAFQQPVSPLFRDYLARRPEALGFYGGVSWDLAAIRAAGDRAAAASRPREAVAEALVRQQQGRGAGAAAERAALLARPDTLAVVTGQQAGLFGGPLYVLHKAVAAQKAAEALERERGRPVVPVFWVASDDHDFAEIRAVGVLDEAGRLQSLRYAPVVEPAGQPAWRIELDGTITALVAELRQALPASPNRDALVEQVAAAYQPGRSLSDAFARLVSALLPGLVVLDPADPALKALAAPVLAREILEESPTSRLALETADALLAAGYHQQVPVRPGFLNVFAYLDGERRALGCQDGTVEVRGTGKRLRLEEARRLLDEDPTAWSPGVLLRPIVQDALLPTAAYVGGPAEIAYHAQITGAYRHFGVPRPVLLPRPSLTLVEPAHARALEAEGLQITELETDPERLLGRWAREAYPEVDAAFTRARSAVERELGAVQEILARLDPTLGGAAESTRGRALHPIEALHEKALRALKKRDQVRADRLRRTRDALFPGGSFQERGLGFVGLLARQGPAVIDEIRARMDVFAPGHQVVWL
jgi:bacillithiol biosynthesis cysteine-adding enzyme BshC